MLMRTRLACAVLAMLASAACTDTDSATDLNPEGPPMIRQVRLNEQYLDSQMTQRSREVFAFGTHALAFPDEVHPVDTATAVGNTLRIIMDEILVGNHLEELKCRIDVDDDQFARIPEGADPDDIARCAAADDVLPALCPASNSKSLCICRRPGGCTRASGAQVAEGMPVGILDLNQDGAADDLQFIGGAVGIQCGSIAVPINLDASFWNPSGTQNRPAMGGFNALGPAIAIVPQGPLPTGVDCNLVFAPEVVDKQGIQVCAPANGSIAAGCTPGDVSAFTFGVEPLNIKAPSTLVPRMQAATFSINAPVDTGTLGGIQITPTPPGAVTITTPQNAAIQLEVAGGWAPATMYTVTFPVTITDTFARPLREVKTYSFTTSS